MKEHPYRAPAARSTPPRAKASAWTLALAVLWVASVVRALAILFDHSLAGPMTGLSIALTIGIPTIVVNARVLAGAHDE